MLVTIMTDASHCQQTKAGGYGFWIASGRGKMPGGGSFKDNPRSSTAAEMMAVGNSLYMGIKNRLVQKGDTVLIQTDCLAVIQAFEGNREVTHEQELDVYKLVKTLQERLGLAINFRHVKGHSHDKNPRYVANNHCDKRAKAGMREARARTSLTTA